MLEKRIYSRQELIEIYKTDRLDAIKKKIKRDGYSYIDNGRGKSYTMQITALPDGDKEFSKYCVEELGFKPQTDFKKLKAFIYNYLYNDEFMTLQYNEMQEQLKLQGVEISLPTISGYNEHLIDIGWTYIETFYENIYYVFDTSSNHNRYIEKEEYKEMYKKYWQTVIANDYDFTDAEINIKEKYGGKPKKRPKPMLNGFYSSQYKAVKEILKKENKN